MRVAIVGATGYVGAELIRLLSRHPHVEVVGLVGRDRSDVPVGEVHAHLSSTGLAVDSEAPEADAAFLALPHGVAAGLVPEWFARGVTVIDLGPDFRLSDPADYPRWYGFEHPRPDLLADAVYGLPELHRAELAAIRDAAGGLVGAPGCYPTATLLALAPLARAGLIGDLVVDAKSGVSGAGREAKADLMFGEVNESVKAYGVGGHRHVAEIEQELGRLSASGAGANPGAAAVDFLPHLIPMTRGILAACHVRPTRKVDQAELDRAVRGRLRRRAVRRRRRSAAGDQARRRGATTPGSTSASTSGPAGSSPSPSSTTSSRAPPARPSRRSTSSSACPRPPASNSSRSRHDDGDAMTLATGRPARAAVGDCRRSSGEPAIPHGFRAGGATVGIKASGRPDLAIVTTLRGAGPFRRRRGLHAEHDGRGNRSTSPGPPRDHGTRGRGPLGLGDGRHLDLRQRQCRHRGRRRGRPGGRSSPAWPRRSTTPAGTLAMSTGIIGTRLPLDKVLPGIDALPAGPDRQRRRLRGRARPRCGRPIRATRSRPRP